MIKISLCLSDLPKEKMKKANNGKIYMNLVVAPRREPDQYENDHTVFCDRSKEEREANAVIVYVGAGRSIKPQGAATPEAVDNMPPADLMNDDLPY